MKLKYNAPVSLTFTLIAAGVFLISYLIPSFTRVFFIAQGNQTMEWGNPLHWLGVFTHIFGHGNWMHFAGNFTFVLLLGPILEEKYGKTDMILMILITTAVVGLSNALFFPGPSLGASGVVFMMIILASVTGIAKGEIPITLLIVGAIYLGREIASTFENNNINEMAHILGGISGGVLGLLIASDKEKPQGEKL